VPTFVKNDKMNITNEKIRQKNIIILLPILISVTFLLLFDNVVYEFIFNKILNYSNSSVRESDGYRVSLIVNGIKSCVETFGFGTGTLIEKTPWHNWWIEVLSTYGVYIFVGYIIFYMKLFKNIFTFKEKSNDKDIKIISDSFCGFMAAFVIACISPASSLMIEWMGMIWALIICFENIVMVSLQQPQYMIRNIIKNEKLNGMLVER